MNQEDFKKIVSDNASLMDHRQDFDQILKAFYDTIKDCDEPILEIGVNNGGSAKSFMDVIGGLKKKNWIITVDPFGSIFYHNGAGMIEKSEYDNDRYRNSTALLYSHAAANNINYCHFKMTSEDFIASFPNIKVYDENKISSLDKFSFVFLDGSHDPEIVKTEIKFFSKHLTSSGVIMVDDWIGERFSIFLIEFVKQKEREGIEVIFDGKIEQRIIFRFKKHEAS